MVDEILLEEVKDEIKKVEEELAVTMPGSVEQEKCKKHLNLLKKEFEHLSNSANEDDEIGEIFFTLTGCSHYFGKEFLEKGMKVKLKKEADNEYDKEAIKVELKGLGHIGYVANSPYTVIGESMSAGRLYDKIGKTAEGIVLYVLPAGALCILDR